MLVTKQQYRYSSPDFHPKLLLQPLGNVHAFKEKTGRHILSSLFRYQVGYMARVVLTLLDMPTSEILVTTLKLNHLVLCGHVL